MLPIYSVIILFLLIYFLQSIRARNIVIMQYGVQKDRIYLCMFCCTLLVLLHTFVNPEYSDLHNYTKAVSESKSVSWEYILTNNIPGLKAEVGFRLLCKAVGSISADSRLFLFICGLMMTVGYYKVVKNYSPMVMLSMLLIMTGPFLQSLFVLRQHITLGLILLSYPFVLERKLFSFLFIIALATTIHQTALVFLPVYFLYNIKKKSNIILISIGCVIVLSFFLAAILRFYVENLASETAKYGEAYLETIENGTNYTMAIITTCSLLLRLLATKKHFFDTGITKLLSIILIFATIFSYVGVGLLGTGRLFMAYTATSFIVLPNTLQYIKKRHLSFFIGIGYWAITFYALYNNWNNETDLYLF